MKIFLAITLYDGKIHGKCSESILQNCLTLMKAGHTVIPYYNSDLYIDRSRNLCVDIFRGTDCTDLVFIDSDLGFDSDAILKLIQHDRDIVAGAYRYKKSTVEFPIILDFSRNNNCKDEETGLVLVKNAPTGLMRIKRNVFGEMQRRYLMRPDERGIYSFFDTGMRFPVSVDWYGEDTFFIKRWRDMGGEVWVEPRINFTHIGSQEFSGNYHEYLMGREVSAVDFDGVASGIPGWMTDAELSTLSYLASKVFSIVEIGSWKGRSTKALLESCPGWVCAVDTWNGSGNDATECAATLTDVHKEFMGNVGHYANLAKVINRPSLDAAAMFSENEVDLVFIDAGHDYEECKADIEAWLPKCKRIIAGHDYCAGFPGVIKAVDEKFKKINRIDSVWWVEL